MTQKKPTQYTELAKRIIPPNNPTIHVNCERRKENSKIPNHKRHLIFDEIPL
jgi:hypothetical protein